MIYKHLLGNDNILAPVRNDNILGYPVQAHIVCHTPAQSRDEVLG